MASLQRATIVHFLGISIRNAAWLLCGYWALAIVVELVVKYWPSPEVVVFVRVLEHFPEKVLRILGFWAPLKAAFLEGVVSVVQVRCVYGAAVMVGLVILSVATGICLWLFQGILRLWASRY
ncbi:MAG: hypothetical protein FWC28_06290 [Proteobacteria bacterium]|nr:hypothetical protein [Cystobacterineae bacterium]MCL2258852.1 hypothetical protein [Cystobacterineae bacterium]MCL2314842.1 hypothetical protein [Pseudomonadota bacterium]